MKCKRNVLNGADSQIGLTAARRRAARVKVQKFDFSHRAGHSEWMCRGLVPPREVS